MDNSVTLTPIVFKNIFSEKECLYIKNIINENDFIPATVESDNREHIINQEDRRVLNLSLKNNNTNLWIYNRIFLCVKKANLKYDFSITWHDISQILMLKYQQGDFYRKHKDVWWGDAIWRRLSIVVQLSNENDYKWCELIFEKWNLIAPKDIWTVIIFPSCLTHEVTKMLEWERYSLVSWFKKAY